MVLYTRNVYLLGFFVTFDGKCNQLIYCPDCRPIEHAKVLSILKFLQEVKQVVEWAPVVVQTQIKGCPYFFGEYFFGIQ